MIGEPGRRVGAGARRRGLSLFIVAAVLLTAAPLSGVNGQRRRSGAETRAVAYRGVSFTYRASLASEVEGETRPAVPLTGETDKPEGAVPRHVSFRFGGAYGARHKSSFFQPELSVYSLGEYEKALAPSKQYVTDLREEVRALKEILDRRPAEWGSEAPFLPFGIDATPTFRTHTGYLDFENGRGVVYLTQFNIEPSLVNNQGLLYTFQGLTDDGRYYVSARFPVTVSFLPPGYDSTQFEDYTLPKFFDDEAGSNEAPYRDYVAKITRRLEALPADGFEPRLTLVDELLRSLSVNRGRVGRRRGR